MVNRVDIEFKTRDKTRLRGWLYRPGGDSDVPGIIMSGGLSQGIDHALAPWAEDLCKAGFAVLVYDHRGWYRSDGDRRAETNPFLQMQDQRDAITFLGTLPGIDKERLGLWGTSYAAGTGVIAAAVDRRIKCIVANVPMISGSDVHLRGLLTENDFAAPDLHSLKSGSYAAAREAEARGEEMHYQHGGTTGEILDYFNSVDPDRTYDNRMSVLTLEMLGEVEPIDYIHRIAPTPLLMILTDKDFQASTAKQLEAYSRARSPKRLVLLRGGHYEPYTGQKRELASKACVEWFEQHLKQIPEMVVCDG